MVYDTYLHTGLVRPNRIGMRILPQQLLETSWVLAMLRDNQILGTLSLIEDSELGLPIASLYPTEMALLRRHVNRVAEMTCLALGQLAETQRRSTLRQLLQAALHTARQRNVDCLTICVHPRHARFYQRCLGFHEFGPTRRCPWVCDHPAVALRLCVDSRGMAATQSTKYVLPFQPDLGTVRPEPLACQEYFQGLLDLASPFTWQEERRAAA